MKFNSIDLFSGCGGLTEGMREAGFNTCVAVELAHDAVAAFKLNHPRTKIIEGDIRKIPSEEIRRCLKGKTLHLLAGCPPCQGFSSIRRLNRLQNVNDPRNDLILEYLRMVEDLRPLTIMMENVPALAHYEKFQEVVNRLETMGYNPKVKIVNVCSYGVPQNRKRLVMVGSRLGNLEIAKPLDIKVTVRDAIGSLEPTSKTKDFVHKIYPRHTKSVLNRIKLTPKNGGSRKDLPKEYALSCHKKKNVGFNDVYGRLRWDDYSTTITGGCLNPSKGRFLHPVKNRCITAREAALLQSFPPKYKFPKNISRSSLALLIGNALPPKFSYYQSLEIYNHLKYYMDSDNVYIDDN
ncbi:DNA (cytosine-5-)-methyltransferase [Candidatus Avelusimicrobium fimicolum]|uniref:DNA cytosine methyltransferase n=1 Tax=Candidatus Avelusimicrobium fimicolum TaxID=3416216 RepID=UPI0015ADE755